MIYEVYCKHGNDEVEEIEAAAVAIVSYSGVGRSLNSKGKMILHCTLY